MDIHDQGRSSYRVIIKSCDSRKDALRVNARPLPWIHAVFSARTRSAVFITVSTEPNSVREYCAADLRPKCRHVFEYPVMGIEADGDNTVFVVTGNNGCFYVGTLAHQWPVTMQIRIVEVFAETGHAALVVRGKGKPEMLYMDVRGVLTSDACAARVHELCFRDNGKVAVVKQRDKRTIFLRDWVSDARARISVKRQSYGYVILSGDSLSSMFYELSLWPPEECILPFLPMALAGTVCSYLHDIRRIYETRDRVASFDVCHNTLWIVTETDGLIRWPLMLTVVDMLTGDVWSSWGGRKIVLGCISDDGKLIGEFHQQLI